MRLTTAGESHGKALVAILEGIPAHLKIDVEAINADLALRQRGYGRGGRQTIEKDKIEVLSGVRNQETLGQRSVHAKSHLVYQYKPYQALLLPSVKQRVSRQK